MSVVLVGLNHKTAPIDVRERVAFAPDQLGGLLQRFRDFPGTDECAILSTCNRTELYAVSTDQDACQRGLVEFLNSTEHLYVHHDMLAVNHLFSVSSGLDSLILGENQILGQVRQAYIAAQEAHTTGPILDKLFPWALKVGKLARSQTKIAQGSASVAAAAVDLARMIFGDLKGRRVLLLGAGKMTRAALGLLANAGLERVQVINRTLQRAEELAARCGGEAMPYEALDAGLSEVDVVLSSTGAPHYLISRERLEKVMRARKGRPLLLVDIAVPRDIEPSCESLDNVYLYNIDDLHQVVSEALTRRHREVQKVLEIVGSESAAFARYLDTRKASTAIRALRSNFEQLVEGELQKFVTRQSCGPAEADNLKQFSQQLLNKLLHEPTMRLRQLGSAGIEPEELLRTLEIMGLSPNSEAP